MRNNQNLKLNPLQISRSDMGLTTQRLQVPHYFKVMDEDGNSFRCCSIEKDAKRLCEIFPGSTYEIVYLPSTPRVVDVPHISVGKEQQLPMQQILPDTQQEPLNL